MEQKSMTALMRIYVRAYMSKNTSDYNFKDKTAEKIIIENEYNANNQNSKIVCPKDTEYVLFVKK